MNDTAPEVAERYRTLIMRRSGGDRLRMACEMFDCARQLMLARIKAEQPDLTASEVRVKIFDAPTAGSSSLANVRGLSRACGVEEHRRVLVVADVNHPADDPLEGSLREDLFDAAFQMVFGDDRRRPRRLKRHDQWLKL